MIGRLESPLLSYYLILGVMTTLVVFGLIMVFSASSVEAMLSDQASYSVFARQLIFAVLGAAMAAVASRLSIATWKRLAVPILALSLLLLGLVIPLGYGVGGNQNWIAFGPISLQPSELAKVALVLVGALIFANKGPLVGRWMHVVLPYIVPITALVLALVLAGHDLGTAMVILIVVASVLAVAGAPKSLFVVGGLVGAAGVGAMVLTSGNRMSRITNFLSADCQSDPNGMCGQSVHGLYALADGGWWGVGLGASKEKWEWLSEAHNDFIFAVIGEELGLPGTLMILFLFGLLALGLLPPRDPHPGPLRAHRDRRDHGRGCSARPSSTSARSSGSSPSSASRSRSCRPVGPRSSRPCSRSACCCPSPATSPAAASCSTPARASCERSLAVLPSRISLPGRR